MKEITAHVREWGRSIGIVIPKETALIEKIKAGDAITLFLTKKNPIKKTFGTHRFKKSTEQIIREIRKEAWDE